MPPVSHCFEDNRSGLAGQDQVSEVIRHYTFNTLPAKRVNGMALALSFPDSESTLTRPGDT